LSVSTKRIEIESRVFIKGRNITKWPLNIKEVANKLSLDKPVIIKHVNDLPSEIGAYTREESNGYWVLINNTHPYRRQRFSACHEFSHLYLGHDGVSIHSWNAQDIYQDMENHEADCFATALLMPADQLYGLSSYYRDIPMILDKAQQYFDVSLSAAAQRITQLSLFEGIIILKDGDNDVFCYKSPDFNEITRIKTHHTQRLDSGKMLQIFVAETYIQLAEMEIG